MRITTDGRLVAPAHITIRQLLAACVPSGWVPPVVPDDIGITVAQAVARDVYGRNHVGAGSFGHHVRRIDLRIADGRVLALSPHQDSDAFWATIGGIGLTGKIVAVELQLRRVRSAHRRRTLISTDCLAQTLEVFGECAAGQWYNPALDVVARLDPTATDGRFGHGVVETCVPAETNHSSPAGSEPVNPSRALAFSRPARLSRRPGGAGVLRYEFAVPENRAWLLGDVLRILQRARATPTRAVLTRFGVANAGALSFPRPGWTMALELRARRPALATVLDTADQMLARYGGRVLLSSDTLIEGDLLASMYPRYEAWLAVRDRLDPRVDRRSARRLAPV